MSFMPKRAARLRSRNFQPRFTDQEIIDEEDAWPSTSARHHMLPS
jgi:hypothetical protein